MPQNHAITYTCNCIRMAQPSMPVSVFFIAGCGSWNLLISLDLESFRLPSVPTVIAQILIYSPHLFDMHVFFMWITKHIALKCVQFRTFSLHLQLLQS